MINVQSARCNLCGGKVVHISSAVIYGQKYGRGYCYLCTSCGAFVGTHIPYSRKVLGILVNEKIRKDLVQLVGGLFYVYQSNFVDVKICMRL